MTDLPSLLATLRDMRAISGDPLVVRVCDDAAEVIEGLATELAAVTRPAETERP